MPDKRDDRHVGGAAADVDHHVARRFRDRQARADGRDHGLLHQVNFARFGAIRRIDDGAFFHLRNLARHSDDDARMHQHLAAVRLLNEVIQHALGDFEVGDDAVLHGPDGDDIAGRTAEHFLRFFADRLDFAGGLVDRDDRGLVDDDPFALGKHERVSGSEIDRKVRGKEAE